MIFEGVPPDRHGCCSRGEGTGLDELVWPATISGTGVSLGLTFQAGHLRRPSVSQAKSVEQRGWAHRT